MKRKSIAGLIAIVAIVAVAMFAGCVDDKPPTPTSTPLAPTPTPTLSVSSTSTSTPLAPTPTPTLSVTVEEVEKEIELLLKELGYDDEVAQYVARDVNSWTDKRGNPILQGWKGELRDAKERYEEGKLSIDKLTDVEVKITKELSQKIKEEIPDYNDDNWHLENVFRDKEANCLGYTQLFLILGRIVGLSIEPIEVREVRESRRYFDHATCLVNLSDTHKVMVELNIRPIFISKSFVLEKEYEKIGNYFKLVDENNPIVLYPHIRIMDKDGLIVGIINSRGATYADLGEYQKAVSDYTKAIEIDPQLVQTYCNRGIAYRNLGV